MNYKLPLDINSFFAESGGTLEQCSEIESIDQYLAVILTTHLGEHNFNRKFGAKLWELDFENVVSKSVWEEMFIEHIKTAVNEHEKRLKDIEIKIEVKDVVREDNIMRNMSYRKRVEVFIVGKTVSNNKKCGFSHTFYIGPLSRD